MVCAPTRGSTSSRRHVPTTAKLTVLRCTVTGRPGVNVCHICLSKVMVALTLQTPRVWPGGLANEAV